MGSPGKTQGKVTIFFFCGCALLLLEHPLK